LRIAYADHPYYLEEIDKNSSLGIGGIALRIGDKIVGLLTFFTRQFYIIQEKEELFLSMCSQVAVMASAMITSDNIRAQLVEIKKKNERLEDEKIYILRELEAPGSNSDMIGASSEIQAVLKLVQQVAYTDSTVLILGETGTGKELVARSIHNNSPRKAKLMVKVNCAALPANLIESELFGHEKGSFTGASERRIGKFELANQGTLFLDEIGEMPLDLQGKLLRALQEKEIERVGGKSVIKVDVRVIVATNRNLDKEVAQGTFRSDLFYRINVFPIRLPPLRDRLSDMPLLASHFITKYALKASKNIKSLSSAVLQELQRYDWPGNIRELEHMIERSVLLTKGDTLTVVDLPKSHSTPHDRSTYLDKRIMTLDENERDHILRVLKMCKGRINGQYGAAKLLGIPPSTLTSKMKRLDIRKQEIRF
jgi:transcriptional regulator with GAF, ATPase, and Fis domain